MDERELARLEIVVEIIRGADPDIAAAQIIEQARALEAYVFGE